MIKNILLLALLLGLLISPVLINSISGVAKRTEESSKFDRETRSEVVFWHFWGGPDRNVVEDTVRRFNESQRKYFVRAVAMPGNNLQAKLFLSVAGEDPPDIVNQDDPILADWAERGIIQSISELSPLDSRKIESSLFDSARKLSVYNDQLFAICNGLDIRALYYNQTLLEEFGLSPPRSIEDLTKIAMTISPPTGNDSRRDYYGYLPDSRRLWAWGYVFGGELFDSANSAVTSDSMEIVSALRWMQSFSKAYGADNIAAFRTGDQSLPGSGFPLLPVSNDSLVGRYGVLMDGQWRTRDIREFIQQRNAEGLPAPQFGVCPLPKSGNGRADAGWVNGNFFVFPKGASNSKGAVEFAKFWIGLNDPIAAAKTCADGGWIPVSQSVVETDLFQAHLKADPLFAEFVRLATSKNQFPTPLVPGAPMFKRTIESAAYDAMTHPDKSAMEIMQSATVDINMHLERLKDEIRSRKSETGGKE